MIAVSRLLQNQPANPITGGDPVEFHHIYWVELNPIGTVIVVIVALAAACVLARAFLRHRRQLRQAAPHNPD